MKKLLIFFSLLFTVLISTNLVKARPAEQVEQFPYQLGNVVDYEGSFWGFITIDFNIIDGGDAIGATSAIGDTMFSFMDHIGIYEIEIIFPQPIDINIKNSPTIDAPIIHQVIGATSLKIYGDSGVLYNGFVIQGKEQKEYGEFSQQVGSLDYHLQVSTKENTYQSGLHDGFNDAREDYGIYHNGQWLTAEQYGNIRYNQGVSEDLNVFQVLLNGFWSFLTILGTFEILPGLKIIHFIALPLVFGIIFFITGKASK